VPLYPPSAVSVCHFFAKCCLGVCVQLYVPSTVSVCHCMCQVLSVCATVYAKCFSACNPNSQVLSVCVIVCAKCCHFVSLYVPSAVSVCHCLCQVLSVCFIVCAKCCHFVSLYVPSASVRATLSAKCCQCVPLNLPSAVSACNCMYQVQSFRAQVDVPSVPIPKHCAQHFFPLFLLFLFSFKFFRLLYFL